LSLRDFEENILKAKEFIGLATLKEITKLVDNISEELENRRILPILPRVGILPSFKEIRGVLKETTDKIYEVGLPQVLVYAVSCLEAFLKDLYVLQAQSNVEILERFPEDAYRIRQEFSKIIKGDALNGDNTLAYNMQAVFQKRHVIVHKAGIIDEKSCEKALWEKSLVGTKLKLTSTIVNEDIETINKFAHTIYFKLIPLRKL